MEKGAEVMEGLNQLYGEIILDHQKDPRNYGNIEHPDFHEEGYNPLCGDRVSIDIQRSLSEGEKIHDIRFCGEGCSICMASASMMTEEVQGKTFSEAIQSVENFRSLMAGQKNPEEFEGDLRALAGVRNFPVRIKCALLPWMTLKKALEERRNDGV